MKPRILYIASSGIRDPLIVSQVLRYLKLLSKTLDCCHLVTLEREPFIDSQAKTITAELDEHGITWHPQQSLPGMRVVNVWREIWQGYQECIQLVRSHDLNLIHARSFIPGNIGLRLAKKTDAKFLYDMRGFWAEEKWAKGTIKSLWIKQQAQKMENRLLRNADALVSLTHAGKQKLLADGISTPIDVIPCCVDTDLFRPIGTSPSVGALEHLISVGSLGPGYLAESVFGIFLAAKEANPNSQLQLLTRSTRETIGRAAAAVGGDLSNVKVDSAGPDQVVDYLNQANVGLCMIQPSVAKIASSPTKLAEYLACGLPVIANCNGIGDMHEIVVGNRVGIAVEDQSPAGWRKAVVQMQLLLQDKTLRQRCRDLAVNQFSVHVGVATYAQIYQQLVS